MGQSILIASSSCNICAAASTLLRTGSNPWPSRIPQSKHRDPAVQLGTIKEYTRSASACPLCRTLLAQLHLAARSAEDNKQRAFADDDVVELAYIQFMGIWELVVLPDEPPMITARGGGLPLSEMRLIRHVDIPRPAACEGEMLAFSPAADHPGPRADISRIRKWVAYCDANHSGTCFAIDDPWKKMDPPSHLYFIDVEEECVSWQPATNAYFALSYVWGADSKPLVSTMENITALCEPGSLMQSSELGKRLPRTIRDAMTVTHELNSRYLWVDRLCIVQDDEVQKASQLATMAAIYGNASITIVADNGDDASSLDISVSPGSGSPGFSVIHLPSSESLLHDSPAPLLTVPAKPTSKSYHRRGWTLQEELLSPRTLKFTTGEIRYLCKKSRFRDLFHDEVQLKDNRTATGVEIQLFKPIPDIRTYAGRAFEYTSRFLTYDTDAVHAFSAIISAFSRAMVGGMFYGLPEFLFEGALLWQPPAYSPPLRRRNHNAPASATAPSWSFLAWQGPGLSLTAWDELYCSPARSRPHAESTHLAFHSRVRIIKCSEVWKRDAKTGKKERVASGYLDEEEMKVKGKGTEGYECRMPILREPAGVPKDGVGLVWEKEVEFVTSIGEVVVGGVLNGSPTDRHGFDGSAGSGEQHRGDVALLSDEELVIGGMRSNGEMPTPGERIPLVLLSIGLASAPPVTWEMPELGVFHAECLEPKMCALTWFGCREEVKERYVPYEFCNVMWVGWRDDESGRRVAHRKGLGRVERKAWEGMKKEEVQVLLG